jgi:hypothetical protein
MYTRRIGLDEPPQGRAMGPSHDVNHTKAFLVGTRPHDEDATAPGENLAAISSESGYRHGASNASKNLLIGSHGGVLGLL